MIAGLPQELGATWKKVPMAENRAYQIGEAGKIRWEVIRYCVGAGVDLGCGPFKIHRNAIGVDFSTAPLLGRQVEANLIRDVAKLDLFSSESFDYVFSSHTLEDCKDWKRALREWWRLVKVGGYLILHLPCKGLYPPMGTPQEEGGNVNHHVDFSPEDLEAAMKALPGGWDLIENQVRDEADEYSFLQVYRKKKEHKYGYPYRNPRPEKVCAVIRYGGIGDHIMTASILPQLKREGWHVVYVTNPQGKDVVEHDPHIDEIWTDTAALTPEELAQYWNWIGTKFPRVINMMNSIENMILPQPGQGNYWLSQTARQALYGAVNYLDAQHLQAEVNMQGQPEAHWYATKSEIAWAEKEKRKLGGNPVIAWSLSGSAVHKSSPFTPKAVSLVLEAYPEAVIVTLGGPAERDKLYQDFPELKQHVRKAGEWGIRESLAFVKHGADIVVGPETGTLNAVGMTLTPKVVWLSHSNAQNLCARWIGQTVAVAPDPEVATCHPCHRLHWGWQFCHQHPDSQAALCVHGIPAETMAEAVGAAIEGVKKEQAA